MTIISAALRALLELPTHWQTLLATLIVSPLCLHYTQRLARAPKGHAKRILALYIFWACVPLWLPPVLRHLIA